MTARRETSPTLLNTLRTMVRIRGSAHRDLLAAGPWKAGTEWARDRQADILHVNGWLEATSARLGMSVAELLDLSEMD